MKLVSLVCFLCAAASSSVVTAVCPGQFDEDNDFFTEDFCPFPIIFKNIAGYGLPDPAVQHVLIAKDMAIGRAPDAPLIRVSSSTDPCSAVVSTYAYKGKGSPIGVGHPSPGVLNIQGSFLLPRFAEFNSNVPAIPSGAGLYVLSGKVLIDEADFTLVSYTGKKPFDVCAALA